MIKKLEKKIVVELTPTENTQLEKTFTEMLENNLKENGLKKGDKKSAGSIAITKELNKRKEIYITDTLARKLVDKFSEERLAIKGYELRVENDVINGNVFVKAKNPTKIVMVTEDDQEAIEVQGKYYQLIAQFAKTQSIYKVDGVKDHAVLTQWGYQTIKNEPEIVGGVNFKINAIGAAITQSPIDTVLHLVQLNRVEETPTVISHLKISLKVAQFIVKNIDEYENKITKAKNAEKEEN